MSYSWPKLKYIKLWRKLKYIKLWPKLKYINKMKSERNNTQGIKYLNFINALFSNLKQKSWSKLFIPRAYRTEMKNTRKNFEFSSLY